MNKRPTRRIEAETEPDVQQRPHRYLAGPKALAAILLLVFFPLVAQSATYGAMVMDARTGEVLHARNADTRLHPASLTKMMTLYVAFEAIAKGEITLDTKVKISKKAAAEPPSRLGLRAGQRIAFRYLIRAAAVKSANDAATAIAEAISGSEAEFARRMNRTAKALGMTRTTFKNAHGLTEAGHLSTPRDMTNLGRRLFYDYPQYYNLFSRKSTDAGIRTVKNTNTKFLNAYKGADGIKTGYTRAAGFNLVASAERGDERIIVTVFGGRSTATRNAKVAELMDLGFRRAPSRAIVKKPTPPKYAEATPAKAGKTLRVVRAVKKSPRPKIRPVQAPVGEVLVAMESGVAAAVKEAINLAKLSAADEASKDDTAAITPKPRPEVAAALIEDDPGPVVVTRASTSGGRNWSISIGKYPSRFQAERELLKTALAEIETLDQALRKVVNRSSGYEANFVGLSEEGAALACDRLKARGQSCTTSGP